MIDPDLNTRIVLVTGGNSGIGEAIVRRFASHGACCIVHYLASPPEPETSGTQLLHQVPGKTAADKLVDEIRDRGGHAVAIAADLADPSTPKRLFDYSERAFGPVDVLVNNAAHCEVPDTIEQLRPGTIDRHFSVNVKAAVLLMQELVVRQRKQRSALGRIINITTDAARTFTNQIAYGASKYALEGFTRSVAVEAGPLGITVNAVAPGPVQTGWITPELESRVLPDIPLGRVGTPEDIADAVVFLASRQARWITGQIIQVAGGHAL
jgi:3-oxoacyl-[acyl-carrier protein] reductase